MLTLVTCGLLAVALPVSADYKPGPVSESNGVSDEGHAISYKVLARGTPVWTSDGVEIGTVRHVLENDREHIFDGIVVDTPRGRRFVDAPEVGRIAERQLYDVAKFVTTALR